MGSGHCNICGSRLDEAAASGDRDSADCPQCGSSNRFRALVLALSRQLFRADVALPDFPTLKSLRALGCSDSPIYSARLAELFSYTNTFYDREPRFDLLDAAAGETAQCDFVICSDVLEHVAGSLEAAFATLARIVKPTGFVILSVPFVPMPETLEHFPSGAETGLAQVGGATVLVARTADGYQVFDSLTFHLGPGATLERRIFSEADLRTRLAAAGFAEIEFITEPSDEFGVRFDSACSLPIVASKQPFTLSSSGVAELAGHWTRQRKMLQMIRQSRWIQLGRKFGVGPEID